MPLQYQIKKSSIQAKTATEDEAAHAGNKAKQEKKWTEWQVV